MKISTVISAFILIGLSFTANAIKTYSTSNPEDIMVYSSVKSDGSRTIGSQYTYIKTFNVALSNVSDDNIDLSELCLKAYTIDNEEFSIDSADDALTQGILVSGKQVKGIAVFSSDNPDILKSALVTISKHC
ncbi:TPA: DUF4354 family protein [Morganella morganii]|nr:DUF4354 family protein [Morganella morganii]